MSKISQQLAIILIIWLRWLLSLINIYDENCKDIYDEWSQLHGSLNGYLVAWNCGRQIEMLCLGSLNHDTFINDVMENRSIRIPVLLKANTPAASQHGMRGELFSDLIIIIIETH